MNRSLWRILRRSRSLSDEARQDVPRKKLEVFLSWCASASPESARVADARRDPPVSWKERVALWAGWVAAIAASVAQAFGG